MSMHNDVFGARSTLEGAHGTITYYRLEALTSKGVQGLEKLPFTVKIILENALRQAGGDLVTEEDVLALARWLPGQAAQSEREYPFLPARVLLQDFTGVPAVADLAAMRSAISRMKGNPQKVNPLVPADLVIDHSVQVDSFGSMLAFTRNVEAAERSGDPVALAAALNAGQNLPWGMRNPADKIRAGERLVELGRETGNRKGELWGHFWRVAGLFEVADMPAVEEAIEAYGRVAEDIRDPSARWRTEITRGVLAVLAGRFGEAERRAAEIRAGMPNQIQVVRVMQGALLANVLRPQGRLAEVVALMDRALQGGANTTCRAIRLCALVGLDRLDEARSEFEQMTVPDLRTQERWHTWPVTLVHLAEAAVVLGAQRQSEIIYELLAPYPDQNAVAASGTAACYGSISRYLGLLAASLGRPDDAAAHYESAVAMNERQGALPYLAYSQCELAETLVRRGHPGDKARALPLLAQSLESATRMGMPWLVESAGALLAKVGGAERRGPLTAREVQIAVLVAGGLSNKQIAERLHLSVRTAENHVENICNKLGYGSRAQIAVWVTERGLR